jgi:thioredoxin-related protein
MSRAASVLALSSLIALAVAPVHAVVDIETSALAENRFELLVVEVGNCVYCGVFRRDVAPAYTASVRARNIPMRFVDLDAPDVDRLLLTAPIETVPTVLVVENGREVGRIAGYVGPQIFFHALNRLLPGQHP